MKVTKVGQVIEDGEEYTEMRVLLTKDEVEWLQTTAKEYGMGDQPLKDIVESAIFIAMEY